MTVLQHRNARRVGSSVAGFATAYASALSEGWRAGRLHQLDPLQNAPNTEFLWRGCNEAHAAIARVATLDCRVTPADPDKDVVIISPHPRQSHVQEIGWAVMGPLLRGQPEIVIGKPNYNAFLRTVLHANGLTILIDQNGGPQVRQHIRDEVTRLAKLHALHGRHRLAFHIYADGHRPKAEYLHRSREKLRQTGREDLLKLFTHTCHPRHRGALSIIEALLDLGRKVEVHYVDLVATPPHWWDPTGFVDVTVTTTSRKVDFGRVGEWLSYEAGMAEDFNAYWADHNRRVREALGIA